MKALNKLVFFSLFLIIRPISVFSQEYGEKEFYLIDSIDLSDLRDYDKLLIDSSLTIYHKTEEDTIALDMLQNIVDNCWNGEVWPRYNNYLIDKVQELLTQNKTTNEQKRFAYYLAGGISNRGFLFDQKGNLLEALNHYHESLLIYEKIENEEGISTAFNNLGVIYSLVGDTARALEYHHKSLSSKKKLKDTVGIAMSYNNIGTIYENANKPFIALEYFEKCLKLSQTINDTRGIAMAYDNIGDIYFREEVFGKAFEFYTRGLEKWTELDFVVGISTGKNNLANVLIKMGNYDLAKIYALESYELSTSLDYAVDIENSAKTLIDIYRHEGDHLQALYYSDVYIKMRDKIRNEQNANKAYRKSMQYEYQKEALKDSLQHSKEIEIQQAEIKQKNTQTTGLLAGLILTVAVFIIGLMSFQRKKKDNLKINEQKGQVEKQKQEIERQHAKLANTHKEISDSITYAKRIQTAILPTHEALFDSLDSTFVLFMPKDVVSGDFYWLENIQNATLIAVADCTGHGVPGAMVSVVCHNALNRAVREFKLTEPALILDKTKDLVIETFKTKSEYVRDGMDISLCKITEGSSTIEWAGANNPLYIFKSMSKSVEIIQSDKQSIGVSDRNNKFTNHTLELDKNDVIYLFTDGFMDQFGGEFGKKFKHSRFRDLVIQNSNLDLKDQKEMLLKEFYSWKNNLEQIDDICIIGIQL